jgi:hypothetical protein
LSADLPSDRGNKFPSILPKRNLCGFHLGWAQVIMYLKAINDPGQFVRIAGLLVRQVRHLNRETGEFFTSSGKPMSDTNLDASARTVMDTITLQQAEDVAAFAARLDRLGSDQRVSAQTR